MRFALKAVGPDGRVESLELQAADRASAVRQVEVVGYTVLSVRNRRGWFASGNIASERFPLVLVSQELLELLRAGLPLVEAIDTLAQKERHDGFRAVLQGVARVLREGRPLSAALEQYPHAFPPLYAATVRASERTGDLAPALERYVAYATQLEAVRKRIVNASIYPMLLLAVGAMVSLFLMLYVVPRFGRIYEERSLDLPLFSRLLLSWGEAVRGHGVLVLSLLAGVAAGSVALLRQSSVRAALGELLWRVPAVGERMQVYQLARFYRTIGMLIQGGMPLVTALEMGADLLHPVLRLRLAAAARAIREGRGVSQSLDANRLTTPVAIRLLVVGEKSGNMGEMMLRIAAFHDEELGRWIDWFTRLFEPLLMAAIGLVIGCIVILMYLPIFDLAGNLQ
jgi:general secretion pathway protein F